VSGTSVKIFSGIALAGLLVLASCNTSGDNGVLGSAAKPGAHNDPENPTQHTKLLNTRNALTDYCPRTVLHEGTGSYKLYKRKASRENDSGLRFQATILKITRDCTYASGQLQMEVGIAGRIINGPSGEAGTIKLPLRIAVRVGSELVYSKLHKIDGTIAKGGSNGQFTFVDREVAFPAPTKTNVRVVVGFDEGPYKTP
jgi:hypothetical protein